MSLAEKQQIAASLDFGARTDTGRARSNNEDSFRAAPELGLFILSDGMGGLDAGEVASRLTVDSIYAHCRDAEADPSLPLASERIPGASETSNRLASAIEIANSIVNSAASADNSSAANVPPIAPRGRPAKMGATVVAAQFFADRVAVAHVGDSRVYRMREASFVQLTDDHSLVAQKVRDGSMTPEQAATSPLQSVLTRALGVEPSVEVEVDEEVALDGDTLLLCSDGLTRELSDAQIAGVLSETSNAQQCADHLTALANQAGGGDNITVIVIRVGVKSSGALGRIGRWIKSSTGN